MTITVTFPEELLIAVREEKNVFSRKVIIYTLGHLLQEGKISGKLVAKILECDLQTAYSILSEYGFSVNETRDNSEKLSLKDAAEIMFSYYAENSELTEFVDSNNEDFYGYNDYA